MHLDILGCGHVEAKVPLQPQVEWVRDSRWGGGITVSSTVSEALGL